MKQLHCISAYPFNQSNHKPFPHPQIIHTFHKILNGHKRYIENYLKSKGNIEQDLKGVQSIFDAIVAAIHIDINISCDNSMHFRRGKVDRQTTFFSHDQDELQTIA